MTDATNITRPSHYRITADVEVIHVREWWLDGLSLGMDQGLTQAQISHLERAMEYILRAPRKNQMEDIEKAYQYLHRALHGAWPERAG